MLQRLIASRSRSAESGPTGAGLIALLGHGALVAGALVGTLRPTDPPHAITAVTLSWPQPPAPTAPPGVPVPAPAAPDGDPIPVTPVQVPPGLPPIDTPRPFDAAQWIPGTTVAVSGDRLADGNGPWAVAVVEELPVLLAGRAPSYPEALRAAGIAGRVVVQAVIDTLGRAEPGVMVVESSHAGFEAPALDYVRRAVFRPARVHGRPVRVLIRLPVDFRLTGR